MLKANSKEEMESNVKRPRLTTVLDVNYSRSTMLRRALGDDARRRRAQYSRPFLAQTTFKRIGSQKNIHLKSHHEIQVNRSSNIQKGWLLWSDVINRLSVFAALCFVVNVGFVVYQNSIPLNFIKDPSKCLSLILQLIVVDGRCI